MANVVLGLATSHSSMVSAPASMWGIWADRDRSRPFYRTMLERADPALIEEITPEKWEEQYQAVLKAQAVLNETVAKADPDVIVIFGDDQHEQFHDDNMPMFCIFNGASLIRGTRRQHRDDWALADAAGDGDHGTLAARQTEFRGAPELAGHLIHWLAQHEVDIARSNALRPDQGLGHAFLYVAENLPKVGETAMLPVHINTNCPPNQPTTKRCYEFGRMVREGIEAWDSDLRVAVLGSGGMSHPIVDEQLDRSILDWIAGKQRDHLCSIPAEKFPGGTAESLNWIAAAGAMEDRTLHVLDYLPAYRTPAGTGLAMAFAYWD